MSLNTEVNMAEDKVIPISHMLYVYAAATLISCVIHAVTYTGATFTELSILPGLAEPLTILISTLVIDLWVTSSAANGVFTLQSAIKSALIVWALVVLIKRLLVAYKHGFLSKEAYKVVALKKLTKQAIKAIVLANLTFPALYVLSTDIKSLTLSIGEFFGLTLYTYGIIIHITSNIQKTIFKKNYPGDFICSGLWKYCRYPDLHGELAVWIGLFVTTTIRLNIVTTLILLILSPVLAVVKVYYLEGGIKSKDKQSEEKYGHREEYTIYKHSTYSLLPKIKSALD